MSALPRSRFLRAAIPVAIVAMALHLARTAFDLGEGTSIGNLAGRWGTVPLVMLATVVCLVGALRATEHRRAWLLMTAGLASFTCGEVIFAVLYSYDVNPESSIADLFYLATYPLLATAML